MYLKSLRLQNLLSFGPEAGPITLGPLNVLIGPNGSGKSNLLEAVGLLAAAPTSLSDAIRAGGGIGEWLWKGHKSTPTAQLEAVIESPEEELHYDLAFTQVSQRFEVVHEIIHGRPFALGKPNHLYFRNLQGRLDIALQGTLREIDKHDFSPSESILSQRRDPEVYPELFYLSGVFQRIRLYRNWIFGPYSPPRLAQPADLPNQYLLPDGQNLGAILNRIRKDPDAKEALLRHLSDLYDGIRDVDVSIEGGTVQVFLHEDKWIIPATRLSDGTLRWLALLAVLLNPLQKFPVCIKEPEMGLHPDLIPSLARLLRDCSQKVQLLVTTHSDMLVDALTDIPESVFVCEKHEGSTSLHRLAPEALSQWLKKYSLGHLWRSGEIGGNRW